MSGTMRAWRTHEYGDPLTALQLDEVPIPDPGPGELRVRVQGIPLNLNDLERITGGNMMVRPDLPYSPGMEVMGVVDGCGDGRGIPPRRPRRRDDRRRARRVRRVRDLPGDLGVPDARRDPAPGRGRALLPLPPRVARARRPRRAAAGRDGADPRGRRRIGQRGDPDREAPRRAGHRDGRRSGEDRPVCGAGCRRGDRLPRRGVPARSARGDRRPRGRRRVRQRGRGGARGLARVHRVQRAVPDDGLRLQQGGRRRAVPRAAPSRARQPQAVWGAARLCRPRHGPPGQDRDGLELRGRGSWARGSMGRSSTSCSGVMCMPSSARRSASTRSRVRSTTWRGAAPSVGRS